MIGSDNPTISSALRLRDRFAAFVSQRPVYHVLGWAGFLIFLLILHNSDLGIVFSLSNELINLVFYAVIVYFNLIYLIPTYLGRGRYFTYLGLLALATLTVTPFKLIVKFILFTNYPTLREDLLANLNEYFVSMFFVAGISTVGKIMADWLRQNQEKRELANQTMQSELRFLKSQINPHFLFNTLNNLYALTLKKSDRAPETVIKLSEIMRYMLYECNEKRVPLRKEINYLENYLELEKLRQPEHVNITFTVAGPVGDQQIAPLLFIPFLENSFKHGLNSQLRDGFVRIHLEALPGRAEFEIENSKGAGQPIPPDSQRPSGGIGLANVRRRLELLYPEQYELSIEDRPDTYLVRLQLNLV